MFSEGYKKIYWGLLLILLNINIGPIDILPNFIGYLLMYSGINIILNNFNDEKLNSIKIIAVILSVWSFVSMFIPDLESVIISMGITILNSILKLILCFNILDCTAKIYSAQNEEKEAEDITDSQRTYTTMIIISLLAIIITMNFANEILSVITVIFALTVEIYYIILINRIRKTIDDGTITSGNIDREKYGDIEI